MAGRPARPGEMVRFTRRAVPDAPFEVRLRTAEERKAPWRACPLARRGMIRFVGRTAPCMPSGAQYPGGWDNGDRIVLCFDPWWALGGSNPGPTGYEPAALPAELKARLRRPDIFFPNGCDTEGTIQAPAPVSFRYAARLNRTRRREKQEPQT